MSYIAMKCHRLGPTMRQDALAGVRTPPDGSARPQGVQGADEVADA